MRPRIAMATTNKTIFSDSQRTADVVSTDPGETAFNNFVRLFQACRVGDRRGYSYPCSFASIRGSSHSVWYDALNLSAVAEKKTELLFGITRLGFSVRFGFLWTRILIFDSSGLDHDDTLYILRLGCMDFTRGFSRTAKR